MGNALRKEKNKLVNIFIIMFITLFSVDFYRTITISCKVRIFPKKLLTEK